VKGIGVDIVEIGRLKRAIERYPQLQSRLFTSREREYCLSKARAHLHFAVRFAAKEAALKALGTGFRGVKWTDMEVRRDSLGRPLLYLDGRAALMAREKGISDVLISLSFSGGNAIASAIALGGS